MRRHSLDGGESSRDGAGFRALSRSQESGGRVARPGPTQALALQRLVGNRATVQALARWTAHPDPEKKGVIVPDVVAAEYVRFNPPKNQ